MAGLALMQGELPTDAVLATDVERAMKFVEFDSGLRKYFLGKPSEEHYRLLAYLADRYSDVTFVDIGTYRGASAVALAVNPANRVITFDIADCLPPAHKGVPCARDIPNVELRVSDCRAHLADIIASRDVPVIMLDVDPHDGLQEAGILDMLRVSGYEGVVILDDIHMNESMARLWLSIPEPKRDITAVGHWSGTGLISFAPQQRPRLHHALMGDTVFKPPS